MILHIFKRPAFLATAFSLVLFLLLALCQKIVVPKKIENTEVRMKEFYALKKKGIHPQILLFGSSHTLFGFSPVELYKNFGMLSYNLGSSGSSICTDFFLLKEAVKTQMPVVVVVDIGRLFGFANEDKYALDVISEDIPLSRNKITLAHRRAKLENPNRFNDTFWGVLFPLYRYHNRWKNLDYNYFNKLTGKNENFFTIGLWNVPQILRSSDNEEGINWLAHVSKEYDNGYKVQIEADSESYFNAIVTLCREKEINFLAVKFPVNANPQWYRNSAWTREKYELVKGFCEARNVSFVDLKYDLNVPIDWAHDSCDGGAHLNILGAKKCANALGGYIATHYNLSPQKNEWYDHCVSTYEKVSYATDLQLTTTLPDYAKKLRGAYKNSTVLIAAQDDMMGGISQEEKAALASLGLKTEFGTELYRHSFIAVIENGKVIYENCQKARQWHNFFLDDERNVSVTSSGWYSGPFAEIKVAGDNVGLNWRGTSIVVIDNESGLVLDSVSFDTCDAGNPEARRDNGRVFGYYRNYETHVLQKEKN